MIHHQRGRRPSRIKHRMGVTEIAMRFLLFVGCVAGIAYLGIKMQKAFETRLRQKALVESVTGSTREDARDNQVGAINEGSENSGIDRNGSLSLPQSGPDQSSEGNNGEAAAAIRSPITKRSSDASSSLVASDTERNKSVVSNDRSTPAQSTIDAVPTEERNDSLEPADPDSKSVTGGRVSSNDEVAPLFSAPNVTLTRMTDGQAFEPLRESSGRIIVLDFWATWCGPCLQELPVVASVVSAYTPSQVRLIAVNTEENATSVKQFVKDRSIPVEVALDLHGDAATAFGVEQLPTLVVIDQQGVVQRIHVGFREGLEQSLQHELDALVSGRSLSPDASIASYLHASKIQSPAASMELMTWKDRVSKNRHTEDMPIRLVSGEEVKVGTRFSEAKAAFEEFLEGTLERSDDRVTKLTYADSGKPSLIFSRRGKELHGPLVSFYEDGTSLAYVQYRFGERISSLLTWDSSGRPLVMEEYDSGVRDGLRCIFKACDDTCKTGHLWMAQEWQKGELLASHVVTTDGQVVLMDHDSSAQKGRDQETYMEKSLALQELGDFETRLDTDEAKIKKSLEDYYGRLRRTVAAQVQSRLVAAGAKAYSLPSGLYPGGGSIPYPFQPAGAFVPRSMTIRNCGSS